MTDTRAAVPTAIPLSGDDVAYVWFDTWREACLRLRFLPIFSHGILLQVAQPDPIDEAAIAAIRALTHREVRPFGVPAADFDRAVAALQARPPDDAPRGAGVRHHGAFPPHAWGRPGAFVGREVVREMVAYAFAAEASDLLLDEQEGCMDVAIKRCGRKEILPPLGRDHGSSVLRAFKEVAGLSTHTVTGWQTGSASIAVAADRRADLRVEVTPTVHGESLVARLQDRERQWERMRRLPFVEAGQHREVAACLRQQQGLILATGPTGHGKTTTLYACLGQLDRSALNIRTLEDPVEFTVPWITQIPVGAGTGRDFAGGLRSLLRQAPHVILLGELRDRAAAQTCLEAVETGHLILATLHTRDAVGVIARLLDLGLTGRQVASALLLAIGQRLVRRLCPVCRRPARCTPREAREFERHGLPVPSEIFVPEGCAQCAGRGEAGMIGIFELFRPGLRPELADLIAAAGSADFRERELRRRWIAAGGVPMVRDALARVAAGDIAFVEAEAVGAEVLAGKSEELP